MLGVMIAFAGILAWTEISLNLSFDIELFDGGCFVIFL